MIRDLSETLKAVLKDPTFTAVFPELAAADIVFDRPVEPFTPPRTTIDVFLYDVRESLELRSNEYTVDIVGNQAITHPAALRLACSYLVTAWPVGGAELALQEHRLLTQVLRVLSRYPMIPATFLKGSMVSQDPPLPMVALHPDALKNLAEFWSSLGSKIKASLTVTVTISVPVFADVTDFKVTTHTTSYAPGDSAPQDTLVQVGGRVLNDTTGAAIPGALVDVVDSGLRQSTDEDGFYAFSTISPGAHSVRVVAVGFKPRIQTVSVPGAPEDYVIRLTPL
jgi:Pvc16 N-terminal domain/Carboxypeptidase regulatory-like domain